jgi:hypothetical protein
MPSTATRGRPGPTIEQVPASGGTEVAVELDRLLTATRQGYLDALPIAGAIITEQGEDIIVECANEHFRLVAEYDERIGDRRAAHIPLLRGGPIGSRFAVFVKSEDPAFQFETADGRSIGGRHFTVRFARLKALPGQPRRILVRKLSVNKANSL